MSDQLNIISKKIIDLRNKINHEENVEHNHETARSYRAKLLTLLAEKKKLKANGSTVPPDVKSSGSAADDFRKSWDEMRARHAKINEDTDNRHTKRREEFNREHDKWKEDANKQRSKSESDRVRYEGRKKDRDDRAEVRNKQIHKVSSNLGTHVGVGALGGAAVGVGISHLFHRKLRKKLVTLSKDPDKNKAKINAIEKRLRSSKIKGAVIGGVGGALAGKVYNNHNIIKLKKDHPAYEHVLYGD